MELLMPILFLLVIFVLIQVTICRWVFRINTIVERLNGISNRLDSILNALQSGFNLEEVKKKVA